MTEVETLLLDSLKKLTKESAAREQRLIEDLESRIQHFLEHLKLLNETCGAFEKRLSALENYRK